MDVLYIPQLDEMDSGGGGDGGDGVAARYRMLRRVPDGGVVALADRAITKIDVDPGCGPLTLVVPPGVKGSARDFFARLVITADEVPEVSLAAPAGETISFEDVDEYVFKCETGVNVFAFTELDDGVFIVNRKHIDIPFDVEFDAQGGSLDTDRMTFRLGSEYSYLPIPLKVGYSFIGWFTEAEGGVEVEAADRCKTGVTRLYAHWEVYDDPFADAICAARNLMFFSAGESPWFVDGGAARSGLISDRASTTLSTTFRGRGTLSFRWRTSCEELWDNLSVRLDGELLSEISGVRDWEQFTMQVGGAGSHTVEWTYSKDGSYSGGEDCGWVDDVVWTPAEG